MILASCEQAREQVGESEKKREQKGEREFVVDGYLLGVCLLPDVGSELPLILQNLLLLLLWLLLLLLLLEEKLAGLTVDIHKDRRRERERDRERCEGTK